MSVRDDPPAPGLTGPGSAAVHRATPVPPRPVPPAAGRSGAAAPAARTRRRTRVGVRRVDPWSVFVLALVISLFLGLVTIVAGVVLFSVLQALGVPDSVNSAVTDIRGGGPVLTATRFISAAALLAAVNVVLLTALATLACLLYNVCASFTGGVEVTLADPE